MDDIICPHCGKKVQIDTAIRHQVEKNIVKEVEDKQKIEFEKAKFKIIKDTEEKLKKEAKEKFEKANKEKEVLEKKLEENKKEQEKNAIKIKEEAIKETLQASRLEKLEYEKKINDMQKSLEEAQRKSKQGSQQLQGEVLELDLEERLGKAFPNDEFVPIPKGAEGADIWQKVKYKNRTVGSILWETKRTKAWSNSWIVKLKDDAAKISASESIIASEVMPEGMSNFDRKDGVWITTYEHAIGICRYVRFLITSVSSIKSSASQTEEEWGKIRDYMMSDSFKHRMQAHFDGIQALRTGFDAEKRATILRWKKQESQIEKLDANTINFYGELKAIASDLPEIQGISSEFLEDGHEDEQEPLL